MLKGTFPVKIFKLNYSFRNILKYLFIEFLESLENTKSSRWKNFLKSLIQKTSEFWQINAAYVVWR